jgi:Glycosyl transferases group 1
MELLPDCSSKKERLLVFDCHEAWIYQLRSLPWSLDIVVGLRGRPTHGWDERMRPVPSGARLIRLENALQEQQVYACIVAHNLTDLLEAKGLPGPRLLVLHETLDGAALEQSLTVSKGEFRRAVAKFVALTGAHVIAVSALKGRSWGFENDIVPFSAEVDDYLPWQGHLARGLRVANHVTRRPHTLLWDFHQRALDGLPITLVGYNPDMPGVEPADNWTHLKQIFRQHRFYVHTAHPMLEDGYNMATVEAMAAGLPILGNRHPTSPVEHGISGFLSDDPAELRSYALRLLADRELASRMGAAARDLAAKRFSSGHFEEGFRRSVEAARGIWLGQARLDRTASRQGGRPAHA